MSSILLWLHMNLTLVSHTNDDKHLSYPTLKSKSYQSIGTHQFVEQWVDKLFKQKNEYSLKTNRKTFDKYPRITWT